MILFVGFAKIGFSQNHCSNQDSVIFKHYIHHRSLQKPENLLSYTITYFLNTPYVSNTLEVYSKEKLVVNLHELDCVTYVENVLSLLLLTEKENSFFTFENNLKNLRYRDGLIQGYLSRLHYFVDWLQDNENKGILKNMTLSMNGIPYKINLFSMSIDSQNSLLKKYPESVDSMKKLEYTLNQQSFYYIPNKEVKKIISQIQTGDIIAFCTNLKGLDVAHLGLALWKKDTLNIVHASSSQKKVVSNRFLNYLFSIKHVIGIIVARRINYKN
ncbi:MAG: N-acetylmuramoyl-L-alanine amidase-like domain-containing protein [Chitinophagaceae bacterium]